MGSRTLALGVLVAVCAGSGVAEELEVVLREGTNFAVALSPVDDSFILDLQGTLWRLPADGGEATALTDGMGDDRMPHISPDGARVVFQSYRAGTWDIWAANVDGSALTALTDSRFDDREPVFSPDGTRVAFSSDRNGNYDIWVLDLEAQELEALTRHEANDFMPAWSPSGDAIAFVSERDSEPALYRLEPGLDGEPSRLASFDGRIAAPSWSPNGSRITLRLLELGSMSADALGPAPESSRLVLVSVDSGEVVDVLTPEDVFPFRTEWSGDTEIVYNRGGIALAAVTRGRGRSFGDSVRSDGRVGSVTLPKARRRAHRGWRGATRARHRSPGGIAGRHDDRVCGPWRYLDGLVAGR